MGSLLGVRKRFYNSLRWLVRWLVRWSVRWSISPHIASPRKILCLVCYTTCFAYKNGYLLEEFI
jgi:hypothetical protein